MKRKSWQPGGGKNSRGELRGRDEWQRISWDEAVEYVASELRRVKETYGDASIICGKGGVGIGRTVGTFAPGYLRIKRDISSFGSWEFVCGRIGYSPNAEVTRRINRDWYCTGDSEYLSRDQTNDRFDALNTEVALLWGINSRDSAGGNAVYGFLQMKKAGTRFYCINPYYNDFAATLDAEWIPIRPGTDIPMMLSMAYTLLEEDDPASNPLIDWDFLERCTIGFDADHMPEGENPQENFKDYVLGNVDGIPKTPEWAAAICGVPVETIRSLTRSIGKDVRAALITSWAPSRTHNSEHWPQLFMTLGCMTGHFGKPGHMTGSRATWQGSSPGFFEGDEGLGDLISLGDNGYKPFDGYGDMSKNLTRQGYFDGISSKRAIVGGNGPGGGFKTVPLDVRMLFLVRASILSNFENTNSGIEAFRSLEFIVASDIKFTFTAQYADIILPVKSPWEKYEIPYYCNIGRETFFAFEPAVEGYFEARSDFEIDLLLAEKFGYTMEELYGHDEKQAFFNVVSGTNVLDEKTLTYGPLVTITQEDIDSYGVEGEPQEGVVGFREVLDKGMYQLQTKPGDNFGYIAYEKFREDPEKYPTPSSESGKMEIHCRALADVINEIGFSNITPYPRYTPPEDGYEASFRDWENRIPGDYPFQLIQVHYLRRAHSSFDTIYPLREAFRNPIFMNTVDAAEKGITQGDTVLVHNSVGKVLRQANITERIMPGCVIVPFGAYSDIEDESGIDRGGNSNTLTRAKFSGKAQGNYNSNLVNFEKYRGEPLTPDADISPIDVDLLFASN
ncbi:MAG: molybdopterin-dependent oxidoreductase [Coriobacteriales bacterium]|nr:molybdopterin-dependent oxidoreductase [Coriobacteriales bacterium]